MSIPKTNIERGDNLVKSWIVCLIAALYFFYLFIQMTKFNAIGDDLMTYFKIGSTGLATLSSMYFWGNLLFLFPAGLLLDRFSTKKILIVVTSIATLSTFLFTITHDITSAAWCFFVTGITGSFGLLLPLRLASRWFPLEKLALASGMIITIGFLGAMVSQLPLTWLVNLIGWRMAIQLSALFGIVLIILTIFFIKDFPPHTKQEMTREEATSWKFLRKSIKEAIGNKQNWLFGIYTSLLNLPIFILGAVFGARFIEQVYGLSEENAATANMLLFLGAMIGSPVFGWLSDKMKLRKPPMLFGGIISIFLILIIMYMPLNYSMILSLFFALGFFTSAQVITYPVITESNTPANTAVGLSMSSILIIAGGAIMIPVFGWLLDFHWNGDLINGIPLHSVYEYRFALWMLPIAFIAGIIATLFGKETHCKRIV